MVWTAKVVDVDGGVYGTLSDAARIGTVTLELNGAGTVDITLPTTHTDAALLLPGREVQILDGSDVVLWGPIVRPQAGLRQSTWQIAGVPWYLNHRFMGRADRVNLLTNGDFEAGETGWTFTGGVTHSIETSVFLEGTQALQLEGGTDDHDSYAEQTYTHVTQYHPLGDYVTLAAWVYVPAADYLGGAIADRGLMIVHRNAGGTAIDFDFAEIGDDFTYDEWVPLEVGSPAVKTGDTLQVLLYPPHGVAYWDLATLTLMESLSFGFVDVADIIEGIVLYAQDTAPYDFGHGKSDLNIDVSATATGVVQSRAYQFAEHRNVLDAVLEFVRQGIVDIDVLYTSTTRTLTTWTGTAAGGIGKGTLFGTTLELDVNVADFTYSWDGERAGGSVVVLGSGDGPDRAEGGATDPTFLDGLTLEIVEAAADDATVGELDQQAAERLAVAKNPTILEVTTLPGAGIVGALNTGDTVPVLISHGWVDIDAVYRVIRISIAPYMDQATITLNAIP